MTPEERIALQIFTEKHPDDWVALVVPRRAVFSSSMLNKLQKHKIWVVNAGLYCDDDYDCERTAGICFTDIYFYATRVGSRCERFMITRHRPRVDRPGFIHYIAE